jgi:hypothetical protein
MRKDTETQEARWFVNIYKKFWEKLVVYFRLIQHEPHRKPKTYGGYTDTQGARRSQNHLNKNWEGDTKTAGCSHMLHKVKLSLYQAVEAHRVVRRRGSHILSRQSFHRWRWGCQPYRPAALYPSPRFLVLISVRGWVDPRVIVRLEGRAIAQAVSRWLPTAATRV